MSKLKVIYNVSLFLECTERESFASCNISLIGFLKNLKGPAVYEHPNLVTKTLEINMRFTYYVDALQGLVD